MTVRRTRKNANRPRIFPVAVKITRPRFSPPSAGRRTLPLKLRVGAALELLGEPLVVARQDLLLLLEPDRGQLRAGRRGRGLVRGRVGGRGRVRGGA